MSETPSITLTHEDGKWIVRWCPVVGRAVHCWSFDVRDDAQAKFDYLLTAPAPEAQPWDSRKDEG